MITRSRRASRLPLALGAVVLAAITAGPIGAGVSAAAAPPREAHPGEIVCKTLTGDGRGALFGKCTNKKVTGGSARFNFNRFAKSFTGQKRGDITFNWASGKITVIEVGGQETGIGSCPPGGPGYGNWEIGGLVVKDTTGKIDADMSMDLCGPKGGWVLEGPADF
jgi:hypothetical protein